MNADGAGFAVLHTFAGPIDSTEGGSPMGNLLLVGSTLYGACASGGGVNGGGTVYEIGADGTGYDILHCFLVGGYRSGDGANPSCGLCAIGSTLYGVTGAGGSHDGSGLTADGGGTIFKINTDGTGYSVLYSFTGGPTDTTPCR